MGRPPIPTPLKVLRGNPGKHPLNSAEPTPPPASLAPPAGLGPAGLDRWNEVAPLLQAMKVLTAADRPALERYCQVFEEWAKVKDHIREHGMTQITQSGYSQLTAEATLFKSLLSELLSFERQFGMTPAARSTLKVQDAAAPQNPLVAYLQGRSG